MSIDGGDILGLAFVGVPPVESDRGTEVESDDLKIVAEAPPRQEGIFGSMQVEGVAEEDIGRVLQLNSMDIDIETVESIVFDAGAPPSEGVIAKMVSEACKLYIHEMIRLGAEEGLGLLEADSVVSTECRIGLRWCRTGF